MSDYIDQPTTKRIGLETEKIDRRKAYHQLEQTKGFNSLSDKQQRMIKSSIYLTQRRQRVPDSYDNFYPDELFVYKNSYYINHKWYCAGAIAALEAESVRVVEPKDLPSKFFDCKLNKPSSTDDITSQIEAEEFPCVVVIAISPTVKSDKDWKHAF